MKRLILPLLLAASQAHAVLSFNASQTTGVQAFGSTPLAADWSTVSMTGAAGTLATVTAVDNAAQALIATNITTQLGTQTANPANAIAQRNSTSNFIYTAATGNNATALMATLQNDSGASVAAINIAYDHTRIGTATEEAMGHRVFYSLTGAANSWTLISPLSGIATNQALSTSVTLSSAWASGAKLYLLWVDDNGSATDTPFTIDNFVVTGGNPAPTVALTAPAAGSIATAPGSFNLSATASDNGSVTQVEFLRNGTVIHTDTSDPYSFTDSGLTAGNYSYTARATDNLSAAATSTAAAVTVFTDATQTALQFDGVNDYVTMGTSTSTLGASTFTIECWFKRTGAGTGNASTGTNGLSAAVPLVTKGRSESDNSNVDCNYFLGIDNATGRLCADFEAATSTPLNGTGAANNNYPVFGTTVVPMNVWTHAAVTWDGGGWKLYLNGVEQTTTSPNTLPAPPPVPRADSIQHFAIGSALNSSGTAAGFFQGVMDEVRVWNVARSGAEIAAARDTPITSAVPGLLARFGLNEGTGTSAASSLGAPTGTLTNGPLWTDGVVLVPNNPPTVSITAPANNASFTAPASFTITASASDSDGTISKVEFFSGAVEIGEDTTAPYTFDVSGLAQGGYSFTAKATDNNGGFTTSSAVAVEVTPPLTMPPSVAITAPANNSTFLAPASITITADAVDSDGSVTKVEFFNGATKLGEDTTAPYAFLWNNVAIGTYTLTAKATDDMTAVTTSAAIAVNVVVNQAPGISLTSPADLATNIGTGGTVTLSASVSDPESQPMTVTFYGRLRSPPVGPDFTLMTLPDTQFYSENLSNRLQLFTSQTNWIVANRTTLNIPFVAHMGDMVNTATVEQEWINADGAMDILENPTTTLLTHGIPWGGAPGNHDVQSGGNVKWNQYFGTTRWSGRPYYQGNYSTNNDNNYQFFSASGLDFIVINLVYNANTSGDVGVIAWADALLKAHPTRRGIITSHWIVNTGSIASTGAKATFGGHGQALYDNLKDNPNLFLMLCGHVHGEGMRDDVFEGRTVYSVLQDYQGRVNGGDSWLRYFIFSPANNTITAKTYQTTTGLFETDADSQFVMPYNMGAGTASWVPLGTVSASGGVAQLDWTGLEGDTEYEWYAAVSDGTNATGSTVRSFTTAANAAPTVSLTSPTEGASVVLPAQVAFEASAADSDGSVAKVEFFAGATKVGEDSTAPFSFAWTAISGSYALTAVATDNQGASTTSSVVNITVTNPANVPPTVAITSPVNGVSTENSSLTISATAADTDGTITKVEFFQGTTKLGEDTNSPFAYNWSGIAVGSYSLTAIATDNDGSTTTSTAVSVIFTPPGNFLGSYTQDFNSLISTSTTPPGTWSVKNAASGTTNNTWTTSIAAGDVAAMVNAAAGLTATTTPSGTNNNGFNAADLAGNTANRVLVSSPTGVAGTAFQLLLTNGTGAPIDALKISYDTLRYTSVATAGDLPGYWLFFSLDNGTTWTNASTLNPTLGSVPNTVGTSITALTTISLGGNWNAGTPLLLRWVDDNATQTSPDQILGLDNVNIVATVIDSDGDGLSDAWEVANGTNPAVNDATSNNDGDANNALLEYAFGTNPAASDSGELVVSGGVIMQRGSPTISTESIPNGVDFRAVFCRRKNHTAAGLTYTVQFSSDLGVWQSSIVTPTVIADDGEMQVVTVNYPFFLSDGRKAQFFRVAVSTN